MSGFGKLFPSGKPDPIVVPVLPKPITVEDYFWVQKARAEMGQKEISGSKDNPRIVLYHSFTTYKATDDETPWCSSFMCFIFGGGTHSAAASSWATWGQHLDKFFPGCIVVRKRTGGHHVHIGIRAVSSSKYYALGGNQGNTVSEESFDFAPVIAYRWPPGVPLPKAA